MAISCCGHVQHSTNCIRTPLKRPMRFGRTSFDGSIGSPSGRYEGAQSKYPRCANQGSPLETYARAGPLARGRAPRRSGLGAGQNGRHRCRSAGRQPERNPPRHVGGFFGKRAGAQHRTLSWCHGLPASTQQRRRRQRQREFPAAGFVQPGCRTRPRVRAAATRQSPTPRRSQPASQAAPATRSRRW